MFGGMTTTGVLTMIGGVLSGVVLLGAALSTIPVVEPYAPATRSFVRDQIVAATAAYDTQQRLLSKDLTDNRLGLLDLKVLAIDGQIQVLKTQQNEIILKLHDTPNDGVLENVQHTIQNDLDALASQRRDAVCEKERVQFPNSTCGQ